MRLLAMATSPLRTVILEPVLLLLLSLLLPMPLLLLPFGALEVLLMALLLLHDLLLPTIRVTGLCSKICLRCTVHI